MIIGIGGVSRAGKTSLALKLAEQFPGQQLALLHQDEYIKAGYNIPFVQERIDWEDPESIDFHRLTYDFHWIANYVDIVILEGLFAFYDEKLNRYYDKKIIVEIEYESFYSRKLNDKRWGEVPKWYIRHIWQSYQKFGKPKDISNALILKGDTSFDMHKIMAFLQAKELDPVI